MITYTAEEKTEAAKVHPKRDGKQVMGTHTRQQRGEEKVTKFFLEDGTEEIGDGKTWPVPKVKAKK